MNRQTSPLLNRVAMTIRTRRYSRATEKSYIGWIKRYILYHGKRYPEKMGVAEINTFLTHLAVREHVSAGTQNQALCALFLYRRVQGNNLECRINATRAVRPKRLPVVLTRDEGLSVANWPDSRRLQEVPGHRSLKITGQYLPGMNLGRATIQSALGGGTPGTRKRRHSQSIDLRILRQWRSMYANC